MKIILRDSQDEIINQLVGIIEDVYKRNNQTLAESLFTRCKRIANHIDSNKGVFEMEKALVDIRLEKQWQDLEMGIG
jgi:hypothetical protein